MLSAGDTLWIPRGTLGMHEAHLCVVTSNPKNDESVLLCLVDTWRDELDEQDDQDPTCKIEPDECGALDFIKVTSYIDYRSSIMQPLKIYTDLLSNKTIRKRQPIPPALLQRIRRGVIDSRFSLRGARRLLSAQGLTGC
jgi:hypothetical protein